MQISTDEGPESNNKLLKSARSSKRIDPSSRQVFNNLTSPGDKNIENLSEGDTIDVNRIYTPWSRWSRCSRRCKQKRERRCSAPQICGSAVVRMERGCHSDRCRGRDFHFVRKRKKLGRKTKVTIMKCPSCYNQDHARSRCGETEPFTPSGAGGAPALTSASPPGPSPADTRQSAAKSR